MFICYNVNWPNKSKEKKNGSDDYDKVDQKIVYATSLEEKRSRRGQTPAR